VRGAALFGRGTADDLAAFRQALGEKVGSVSDRYLEIVVHQAVQRSRNWAHINSLREGRFALAEIVATLDAKTTAICRSLNGKRFRVGVAADAIDRFSGLSAEDFAAEAYESDDAVAFRKDPVGFATPFITDGLIDDRLTAAGLSFPPFHIRCRSRVKGVFNV
jgi:hypothetical protein